MAGLLSIPGTVPVSSGGPDDVSRGAASARGEGGSFAVERERIASLFRSPVQSVDSTLADYEGVQKLAISGKLPLAQDIAVAHRAQRLLLDSQLFTKVIGKSVQTVTDLTKMQ